jgi:hypothetical protein
MATGQFLDLAPALVDRISDTRSSAISTEHTEGVTVDVPDLAFAAGVRELGSCILPHLFCNGAAVRVRGFLLPSIFTGNQKLSTVVESFPRWVWEEWRALSAYELARGTGAGVPFPVQQGARDVGHQASLENTNPLIGSVDHDDLHSTDSGSSGYPHGSSPTNAPRSRTTMNSRSKTTSIATSRLEQLPDLYNDNGEAPDEIPASAVHGHEITQLIDMLVPYVMERSMFNPVGSENDSSRSSVNSLHGFRHKVRRLQAMTSLASYFVVAYRIVLMTLDVPERKRFVARLSLATAVPPETFDLALAARCARFNQQYLVY